MSNFKKTGCTKALVADDPDPVVTIHRRRQFIYRPCKLRRSGTAVLTDFVVSSAIYAQIKRAYNAQCFCLVHAKFNSFCCYLIGICFSFSQFFFIYKG